LFQRKGSGEILKNKVREWARDMWEMFESLPKDSHSDRVDFEIAKILQKHGIPNSNAEKAESYI
jgi:hypothetical protein